MHQNAQTLLNLFSVPWLQEIPTSRACAARVIFTRAMDLGIERNGVQHDTIETSNDTQGIPRLCLALSLNP